MKNLMLITSVWLSTASYVSAITPMEQANKQLIQNCFRDIIENMQATEKECGQYMSKDYIQKVDGKTLTYLDFIKHVKAQKQTLKSVKIIFDDILTQGNKVATHHRAYAIKKDNTEVEAEVIAFFEIKDGKIISCKELTRLVKGQSSDQDLGSRH